MLWVENLEKYYHERESAGDWAQWARENEEKNTVLTDAMLIAREHASQSQN